MLSWKIGDVKVTRIVEMDMPVKYHPKYSLLPQATPEELRKMPWLYPHFVNEADELLMSIHALLVEAPGMRLVVDTCIGNDKPRNFIGGNPLSTPFLQHLADALRGDAKGTGTIESAPNPFKGVSLFNIKLVVITPGT